MDVDKLDEDYSPADYSGLNVTAEIVKNNSWLRFIPRNKLMNKLFVKMRYILEKNSALCK